MSVVNRLILAAREFVRAERLFWGAASGPTPGAGLPRVTVGNAFDPSAIAGQRTIAPHGLGVFVPANAHVIRAWYDVITTFTSAGADAGTLAISVEAGNDIVTATAISAGTNSWDAGMFGATPAKPVKATQARELTVTVAGQALLTGKMYVFAEYVLGSAT